MKITDVVARDVRFPTSEDLSGSNAMNEAPRLLSRLRSTQDGYQPIT